MIDASDTDDTGFVESDISVCHRIGRKGARKNTATDDTAGAGAPGRAAENKKPQQIIDLYREDLSFSV